MGLKDYHKKRDFKKTSEPKGAILKDGQQLFIIQKHAASHLHYDFRLELKGVLLSWAVPKGPCFDSKVKRLAMHVEDHPVEYGSFEGIIPKGQYGGGTVMLWDRGHWSSLDPDPYKAYKEGHMRFTLEANKLKGRWDLFTFKDDKHWFLVKYNDDYAKPLEEFDITLAEPLSVLTNQSLEEIESNYQRVWTTEGSIKATSHPSKTEAGIKKNSPLPKGLKKNPFPKIIHPQLATLVRKAPEGQEWLHEIKWDGYRIVAFIENNKVTLKSRRDIDWTAELESVALALEGVFLKNTVLDGEVVLLDEKGKSDFQLLQNTIKNNQKASFLYCIFDIIYYDQFDLKSLPLIQRKKILSSLLPKKHPNLFYSDHIINDGAEVFHHSCERALEGIISKRVDSQYEEHRSKTWVKVKCMHRQEFVIGGYSNPRGNRDHFGSLYLGVYNEEGELEYAGNVGTGFTQLSLKELHEQFQQQASAKNPFNKVPPEAKKANWLKPVLVAEVEFSQWTNDNHLRHPSFKGLRGDKLAKEVRRETEINVLDVKKERQKKVAVSSKTSRQEKTHFAITHPEKILYPEDQFTKQDILDYYDGVADFILPYIKNRPLSLVRCPESYHQCFFQRHFNATTPKALKAIDIESKGTKKSYIYLDDKEGLLSLVQMGVLEIHPWGSSIQSIEAPDMIIFDLDPAPDVTWKTVVAAAWDIKEELAQLELQSFVKTTGGKGLHVIIPIQPQYNWEEIKNFTRVFVEYLEKKKPKQYISNMSKVKREGKIFVDYLRNQRSATAVGAYSTRSRIHATVSVPLEWEELSNLKKKNTFTIKTLPARLLALKTDPWEGFWKVKQTLPLSNL